MQEEQEYKGEWWLPGRQDQRVAGTLRLNAGRVTLDLIGLLGDLKKALEGSGYEIILGSAGKDITLFRCHYIGWQFNSSNNTLTSLKSEYAFLGAHFENEDKIKFHRVDINIPHVNDWVVGKSNFDEQIDQLNFTIKYTRPKPIEILLNDGFKFTIITSAGLSSDWNSISLKEESWIGLESLKELPLAKYLKIIHNLSNFFSLATNSPIYPTAIESRSEINKDDSGNKVLYPPINIYYSFVNPQNTQDIIHSSEMLFNYMDITNPEVCLNNWFEKSEILEPICSLYFASLYNPRLYSQNHFLNLIQALESYHRRMIRNFDLPENQHRTLIEEILAAAPQGHRNWLNGKLKYSNELTLRARLKEMLNIYSNMVNLFQTDFIEKVLDTRNYLTHYDQSLKEKAAKGEELYHITQKLKLLVEACLLCEIGFTNDQITKLFSRNSHYQRELEINS